MSETPRKKRFQIHLSTAIVLMFVAGGLIWLNTRVHTKMFHYYDGANGYAYKSFGGWPISAVRQVLWDGPALPKTFKGFPFLVDLAVALSILFAVWFLCEWWIRRRAAKKRTGTASAKR